jgi:hypothetical protein
VEHWTREQARLYQLVCVGLHGVQYPAGTRGIDACFRDLGSVQLDPLPILGRNHDLVIHARVPGTSPGDFLKRIHEGRVGFEYWDKALCAIVLSDYPLFRGLMAGGGDAWTGRRAARLETEHPGTLAAVEKAVQAHGPLSSKEFGTLDVAQEEHRGWKATRAANVALDALWNSGDLAVAFRRGFRRYFDLADRVIPADIRKAPTPTRASFLREAVIRRVRTVGLLAATGSADAWMMVRRARREGVVKALVDEGALIEVHVEGARSRYYAEAGAADRLRRAERTKPEPHAVFIAPLDPLLWSREALRDLWDFDYVWEVYKPAAKRRYGYYVLPLLHGTRLAARFDGRYERKDGVLQVISYQPEPNGPGLENPLVHEALQRMLRFLGGETIALPDGGRWARGRDGGDHPPA